MKNKILLKIIFLICFISCNVYHLFAQSLPFKFSYLTVDEGLSHTDANDVVQDKKGYIWMATYFGLNRYDGYAIKKYYNNNFPIKNAFKNRIRDLYPDDDGNIWLGTEDGLQCFDPRSEKYIDYINLKTHTSPFLQKIIKPKGKFLYGLLGDQLKIFTIKANTVDEHAIKAPDVHFTDIVLASNGLFYLSSNKGIWILDKQQHLKKALIKNLENEELTVIYLDRHQNLITASTGKIFLIKNMLPKNNPSKKQFTIDKIALIPNTGQIKNIAQTEHGDYWLNNGHSLIRVDQNLGLSQTISSQSSQHSLNSNRLSEMLIDRSGCLWVGTFGGGVNYCDLNAKLFYTLQHDPKSTNSLSGNHIRSILCDGQQLWIGTNGNGLNLYNLRTKDFTLFGNSKTVRLKNQTVSSLALDNDHNLWIGSESGIDILKPNRKDLYTPIGSEKFPCYVIETLVKDYFGNIWFGNHVNKFGVIYKDSKNHYQVKYYDEGYFIFADKNKPQLLVSSTNGLKRFIINKTGDIIETYKYKGANTANSLSSDYTYPISKRNDSTYWVGTMGGGLNQFILKNGKNNFSIKVYDGRFGVFNDVESLEIDDFGNIWMGGNGLECLNPKTGKLIRYDKNDGLQGNSFKVGSSFKGADGRLYFGGINGLNYFYPKEITVNKIAAHPAITDILINNQKPTYGKNDEANIIGEAIGYAKEMTINYLQNNFVISFSSMHFANPLKCRYRYKLVGFEQDWKYTDGKKPSAAYSNLNFKRYRFIVQATNNDGFWSNHVAEIDIVITPPWWKSNLAITFYTLLAITALSAIYIFQGRWYRLKREFIVRNINEEKREEMHKQRDELSEQQLMFFTNISHEFRTPLTLITGPLENLIHQNKDPNLDNPYQLMYRNAKRLLNLISELMNFKKIAENIISLKVENVDLNEFFISIGNEFENLAQSKNIAFTVIDHTKSDKTHIDEPIDVQVLEKILFNLLNNAFKYTGTGGTVAFELFTDTERLLPSFEVGFELLNTKHTAEKYIYFRVIDSGIGISEESITKIFDRYYRISNEHLGSGVGLALVKSLTELHKGNLFVYSLRNKGTEIIIGIPLGKENYILSEDFLEDRLLQSKLEPIDNSILLPIPKHQDKPTYQQPGKTKRILLVEDNEELRLFLRNGLEANYQVYEASNGISAVELATEHIPDLIISDVMMPGMDGIEFCGIIKEKFETRHIPFIILSANDALGTKLKGMESGADYYFAKPLNMLLLLLTIQNIFEQAEKLKIKYATNYLFDATELVTSEKDKAFFDKLLGIIESNISDPKLDVDFLCDHLFISRTKLYQKIKGISDQSVGEFIRTIRLKTAIKIMTHEDVPIYEVAERIGLQSSSNFSRAFKKEHGKSPLQFIQSLKETPSKLP